MYSQDSSITFTNLSNSDISEIDNMSINNSIRNEFKARDRFNRNYPSIETYGTYEKSMANRNLAKKNPLKISMTACISEKITDQYEDFEEEPDFDEFHTTCYRNDRYISDDKEYYDSLIRKRETIYKRDDSNREYVADYDTEQIPVRRTLMTDKKNDDTFSIDENGEMIQDPILLDSDIYIDPEAEIYVPKTVEIGKVEYNNQFGEIYESGVVDNNGNISESKETFFSPPKFISVPINNIVSTINNAVGNVSGNLPEMPEMGMPGTGTAEEKIESVRKNIVDIVLKNIMSCKVNTSSSQNINVTGSENKIANLNMSSRVNVSASCVLDDKNITKLQEEVSTFLLYNKLDNPDVDVEKVLNVESMTDLVSSLSTSQNVVINGDYNDLSNINMVLDLQTISDTIAKIVDPLIPDQKIYEMHVYEENKRVEYIKYMLYGLIIFITVIIVYGLLFSSSESFSNLDKKVSNY